MSCPRCPDEASNARAIRGTEPSTAQVAQNERHRTTPNDHRRQAPNASAGARGGTRAPVPRLFVAAHRTFCACGGRAFQERPVLIGRSSEYGRRRLPIRVAIELGNVLLARTSLDLPRGRSNWHTVPLEQNQVACFRELVAHNCRMTLAVAEITGEGVACAADIQLTDVYAQSGSDLFTGALKLVIPNRSLCIGYADSHLASLEVLRSLPRSSDATSATKILLEEHRARRNVDFIVASLSPLPSIGA